jgi:HlyD family secretion protein
MTHDPAPRRALLATAVLAAALALGACARGGASTPGKSAGQPPATAYLTIANGKVDVEGGIVEVAARRPGTIREVLVQEGDSVRKGQVLARLDDRDLQLAIGSARAVVGQATSQLGVAAVNLRTASRERARLEALAKSGLVARQQLDAARDTESSAEAQAALQKAAVATAEAELAQAEYAADMAVIRAPLDGKIIRRYANPGAGASTLNVSNLFDLEPVARHIVRAEIIESALPDVRVDQPVEIASEGDSTRATHGTVLRIARAFGTRKLKSDTGTEATDERVVEVVVSADGAPYLIGQRVMVKFLRGEAAPAPALAAADAAR